MAHEGNDAVFVSTWTRHSNFPPELKSFKTHLFLSLALAVESMSSKAGKIWKNPRSFHSSSFSLISRGIFFIMFQVKIALISGLK